MSAFWVCFCVFSPVAVVRGKGYVGRLLIPLKRLFQTEVVGGEVGMSALGNGFGGCWE